MTIGTDMLHGLRPAITARSRHAFVTLVTNADYAMGATALARSLVLSRTSADIVVLYRTGLDEGELAPLLALGCRLVEVDPLPLSDPFNERHERKTLHAAAPFEKGRKPDFHSPLDNFCKLRLWQLTEYRACVFIDADAVVLKNIDRLFDYPEFSAAPNVYQDMSDFHRLNSGVFVARPSIDTFHAMLERLDQPGMFWRRTDQTFLESYFPDWHGLPVFYNMLQYVWFNMPALWDWQSICVLHYQYEKPWETGHPKAETLRPLIDLWEAFYRGTDVPDVELLANPENKQA